MVAKVCAGMRFVMDARYAGPETSGIGNYVRAIGSRIPSLAPDAEFRFWVRPGTNPLSNEPRVTHARVRAAPASVASLLWPRLLDRLDPDDVFHAPANILGFGVPCPAIVTVHDVMWLEHLDLCQPRPWLRPISGSYYSTGIYRALRRAERILTVSRASADAIVRLEPGAASRIVITPNACDAHFLPPASPDAARTEAARIVGSDAAYFLVVGQNQPSKAHDVAVRAFAAANLPNHRLVLVQRLELGRGLGRVVRELGIEDRVVFVQGLSTAALVALLQSALALLQPSLVEGFGLPALEAMASGCPVIASDIPPLREILGKAGIFVAKGSVSELAAALERAAASASELEQLRGLGLERARGFSWDRTAQLTLEVYRDVAHRGRRRAA